MAQQLLQQFTQQLFIALTRVDNEALQVTIGNMIELGLQPNQIINTPFDNGNLPIVEAACSGSFPITDTLLQHGVDFFIINPSTGTSVMHAIVPRGANEGCGNFAIITNLLRYCPNDALHITNENGESAFTSAAISRKPLATSYLNLLLETLPDVNLMFGGKSLAHWAAASGSMENLQVLHQHMADFSIPGANGNSVAHEIIEEFAVSALRKLLAIDINGAVVNSDGLTPYMLACAKSTEQALLMQSLAPAQCVFHENTLQHLEQDLQDKITSTHLICTNPNLPASQQHIMGTVTSQLSELLDCSHEQASQMMHHPQLVQWGFPAAMQKLALYYDPHVIAGLLFTEEGAEHVIMELLKLASLSANAVDLASSLVERAEEDMSTEPVSVLMNLLFRLSIQNMHNDANVIAEYVQGVLTRCDTITTVQLLQYIPLDQGLGHASQNLLNITNIPPDSMFILMEFFNNEFDPENQSLFWNICDIIINLQTQNQELCQHLLDYLYSLVISEDSGAVVGNLLQLGNDDAQNIVDYLIQLLPAQQNPLQALQEGEQILELAAQVIGVNIEDVPDDLQ